MFRKSPRWTVTFLRALERTGEVRMAALDAGIDHTTAYHRRRTHGEFAEAWEEALRAGRARVEEEALAPPPFSFAERSPSPSLRDREDVLVTASPAGPQLKRVNEARWNKAAERRFFAALADTANVKLAADAAGFSTAAVYARRLRHALFREQWAAAVETGRARLELALIAAANLAFDTAVADVPEDAPQVSVNEALQILKIGAEPRAPSGRDGQRRLNAGARANLQVATNEEIADALAKRLAAFGKRVASQARP